MRVRFLALLPLALSLACGDESSEDPVEYEQPQIVPESNLLCLSYQELTAGETSEHYVLLSNLGRNPLLISGASVEDDLRGSFSIGGLRSVENGDCTEAAPCEVRSRQDAILQYRYAPTEPGWDATYLRVRSNAENYPNLRLFVLAKARPPGLAAGEPYDAGPKPAVAVGADGSESCP